MYIMFSHPQGSYDYTFSQARSRCKRMRISRRPKNPQTVQHLVDLLNVPDNTTFTTTLQEPPSTFFQQPLIVEGVFVGVIFANLDLITRFEEVLNTVLYAGCDGTFKTVPRTPSQLRKGTFMTFQIVYKNVVS